MAATNVITEETMRATSIVAIAGAALLSAFSTAHAAELKILSGNGGKAAVTELSARFERETGVKIITDFAVNPTVRKRVMGGEAFDVAVLNPPVLDDLIKEGKIVADTRGVIGRIGLGVGIKAGAPKPDISTVAAFRQALLNAKSVAYPEEGASGIYFASLVKRLGIENEMKSRLKPMPGEYNVEVVATGEADMVVVVASRIFGVPGVQMIGLIPQELQTWIGFTTGVGKNAKEPDLARKLTRYFTAPSSEPFLRKMGIEPFVE
jgi:molybdate transport system substrate-binding protein